jgi:putative ABC transport system permease protein
LVFAGVALFVGAFIIYNTFSITVAQRTQEFGLLRALGASGGQVMTSVVVEAILVGLIASVIGIGVGLLIAAGLNALLEAFGIDLPSSGLELQARTIVVSLSVGTLVTVASAILPARKAARVSPMEALREAAPQPARFSRLRILAGVLITLAGAAILMVGLMADVDQPIALVGAGALVVFLGVAFLAPLFAGLLARVVGAPAARLGLTGKLAQKNAERNPRRTAATASALMIGLALVGLIGIFSASLKATTNKVVDESLKADFTISPTSITQLPMISPEVAEAVAAREEVGVVAPFRLGQFRNAKEQTLYIVGTDPSAFEQTADIEVSSGDLSSLTEDEVFLYAPTGDDLGLSVGEPLRVRFPATGAQELEVVGLFENKALLNADYIVSMDTFEENFPDAVDSSVFVTAAPGVDMATARRALDEVVEDYPSVRVQDQTETKEQAATQVDQLLGLVTALLGLALLIALLGITNTLALSVFERTRELGLLRAVGMMRRQARAMIRWESVIIAIIGALLGIAIGIFFGWALVTSLESEGISELDIPGGQLILYVVIAGLAGVIAAIPPARRAARLNVLEALQYE